VRVVLLVYQEHVYFTALGLLCNAGLGTADWHR